MVGAGQRGGRQDEGVRMRLWIGARVQEVVPKEQQGTGQMASEASNRGPSWERVVQRTL